MTEDDLTLTFGRWLWAGSGGRRGISRVVNFWMLLHLLVGSLIALAISAPLSRTSQSCLLPAFSILIGLTFAWIGNAQGLLQTKAIRLLGKETQGGLIDFIFAYQLNVLILLVAISIFAIASLSPFEQLKLPVFHPKIYFSAKALFYSTASLTVGTAWSTINGSHALLRAAATIEDALADSEDAQKAKTH